MTLALQIGFMPFGNNLATLEMRDCEGRSGRSSGIGNSVVLNYVMYR